MINYRNYSVFRDIDHKSNVIPFSRIHKYVFKNDIYYNLNISVPKMFQLSLKLNKGPHEEQFLYLYDISVQAVTYMKVRGPSNGHQQMPNEAPGVASQWYLSQAHI